MKEFHNFCDFSMGEGLIIGGGSRQLDRVEKSIVCQIIYGKRGKRKIRGVFRTKKIIYIRLIREGYMKTLIKSRND